MSIQEWFDDIFRSVRASVDHEAYERIGREADSRTERKERRDELRAEAGRQLWQRMMADDPTGEKYLELKRSVANIVLKSNDKLAQSPSDVDDIIYSYLGSPKTSLRDSSESHTSTRSPTSRNRTSETQSRTSDQNDKFGEEAEYDQTHDRNYIPPTTIAEQLVSYLLRPVEWGKPLLTSGDVDEPFGLVVEHFYNRMLSWLDRNRIAEADESNGEQTDSGDALSQDELERARRTDTYEGVADVLNAEIRSSDYGLANLLDYLLELKYDDRQHIASSSLSELYDRLLQYIRRFLADEKSRTRLGYRSGFAIRKLFPAHAWPVVDSQRDDVAPVYEWLQGESAGDAGALDDIWSEMEDDAWKQWRRAIELTLSNHQSGWGDTWRDVFDDEPSPDTLLDRLATLCTKVDAHLPVTTVSLVVDEVSSTIVLEGLREADPEAGDELRRAKYRLERQVSRLNGDVWDWADEHVVDVIEENIQADRESLSEDPTGEEYS